MYNIKTQTVEMCVCVLLVFSAFIFLVTVLWECAHHEDTFIISLCPDQEKKVVLLSDTFTHFFKAASTNG